MTIQIEVSQLKIKSSMGDTGDGAACQANSLVVITFFISNKVRVFIAIRFDIDILTQ